jgi:hypothetical protein
MLRCRHQHGRGGNRSIRITSHCATDLTNRRAVSVNNGREPTYEIVMSSFSIWFLKIKGKELKQLKTEENLLHDYPKSCGKLGSTSSNRDASS